MVLRMIFSLDKPYPLPLPAGDFSRLELIKGIGMTLLIRYHNLKPAEKAVFADYFSYAFFLSPGTVPVCLVIFRFPAHKSYPAPYQYVDMSFNSQAVTRETMDNYLKTVKNSLCIHLIDGEILRMIRVVGLSYVAARFFHDCLQKQMCARYTPEAYAAALIELYEQYTSKQLFHLAGNVWHHPKQKP
jgi:hypothetical protein